MKITSGRNPLAVGVDYREEYPKVCYQSIQMKEAQPLPLDFTGQTGRCACFRKVLSALKRFAVKEEMQVSLVPFRIWRRRRLSSICRKPVKQDF